MAFRDLPRHRTGHGLHRHGLSKTLTDRLCEVASLQGPPMITGGPANASSPIRRGCHSTVRTTSPRAHCAARSNDTRSNAVRRAPSRVATHSLSLLASHRAAARVRAGHAAGGRASASLALHLRPPPRRCSGASCAACAPRSAGKRDRAGGCPTAGPRARNAPPPRAPASLNGSAETGGGWASSTAAGLPRGDTPAVRPPGLEGRPALGRGGLHSTCDGTLAGRRMWRNFCWNTNSLLVVLFTTVGKRGSGAWIFRFGGLMRHFVGCQECCVNQWQM